jgi:hypothetical protein
MGNLVRLGNHKNSDISSNAKKLEMIVRSNPSLHIEDENQLCENNGILTSEQSPGPIRYSIASNRVSVRWQTKAASEDDVALWGIIAPPNDKRKRENLEGWMKRHASKVEAAQKKLDHSTQEILRIRNEAVSGLDSESMNEEKKNGV